MNPTKLSPKTLGQIAKEYGIHRNTLRNKLSVKQKSYEEITVFLTLIIFYSCNNEKEKSIANVDTKSVYKKIHDNIDKINLKVNK